MSMLRRKPRLEKAGAREHAERLDPGVAQARIEAAFKPRGISALWCVPPIVFVWALAAVYFFFLPPTYHSNWSLILPAANNGSTVSLETIGQTSTSPSHPFGSVSLSPKVIYKEIAGSTQVRQAAARSMKLKVSEFGKPRVKLIDETSLMMFRMKGRSPEQARAKARALMVAFENQLNVLRQDERARRAKLVRENLKVYRANLENVRSKMLAFQKESGLLSINQFKEAALSAELLRRRLAEQRADRQRLVTQHETLTARVGLSSELAAVGVRLASDPAFSRLATVYARDSAEVYESHLRYGRNHPKLGILRMKAKGVFAELQKIARARGLTSSDDLKRLTLVFNRSNQSELLRSIIANESALAGKNKEVRSLQDELGQLEIKVTAMGKAAARLEALEKDHLVVQAVFTSAAARLDIGRTDLFASYPMVQVLAQPDLPENRSQPRLKYAILAGILGTFFVLLAWGAAWVRIRFSRRR